MTAAGTALKDELKRQSLQGLLDTAFDKRSNYALAPDDDFLGEELQPEEQEEKADAQETDLKVIHQGEEQESTQEHSKSLDLEEEEEPKPKVLLGTLRVNPYKIKSAAAEQTEAQHKIGPTLLADLMKNSLTYMLMAVLCALALFKIYQVQSTRSLIAEYNDVRTQNESLEREWLELTSQAESLTIHSKIREQAVNDLKMISPATEDERVITLR